MWVIQITLLKLVVLFLVMIKYEKLMRGWTLLRITSIVMWNIKTRGSFGIIVESLNIDINDDKTCDLKNVLKHSQPHPYAPDFQRRYFELWLNAAKESIILKHNGNFSLTWRKVGFSVKHHTITNANRPAIGSFQAQRSSSKALFYHCHFAPKS